MECIGKMKNKFIGFVLVLLLVICPIFVGCEKKDEILGSWQITGYYYNYGGQEKYVTLEQAAAIVYDDTILDQTSEQAYLNAIKYIEDARHLTIFEFKEDGVLSLTGADFEWSRQGDLVIAQVNGQSLTFEKVDNNVKASFPAGDLIIYLMLER